MSYKKWYQLQWFNSNELWHFYEECGGSEFPVWSARASYIVEVSFFGQGYTQSGSLPVTGLTWE